MGDRAYRDCKQAWVCDSSSMKLSISEAFD